MTAAPRPVPWGTEFAKPFSEPPTATAPVVEVQGCADCQAMRGVGRSDIACDYVQCGIAGRRLVLWHHTPSPLDCPLRSGPVTLRLVDRGRP